ncbi:HD-GYP domain-containing protein [Azonexus caeni]|jgi:HD-GYP domain-containing protein (c-di-GMP phosphodiesterase class II)|uniref:HD-GYP domain-containing protein n=1 Tax=Azonexus caeni TaxID=266126 RepID=UPI002C3FA5C2|nr:HD-GYP domain-containing protein [Azonexus sp.]
MEIIPVAELKIGMFITEPDCPWTEFSFALQGFIISKPEQVEIFRKKCRFVQIDRSRSLNEHFVAPKERVDRQLQAAPLSGAGSQEEDVYGEVQPLSAEQVVLRQRRRRFLELLHGQEGDEHVRSLTRELDYIEPRYDDLLEALKQTFRNVTAEMQFDFANVREGVRDIAGSLKRNPDAVMWLLRLKSLDQYSFDHAMDVAVHALLLAGHIGWRGQQLLELGIAGLLQDVGKTQVPSEVLAKKEALTEAERQLVRSHVASSLEILTTQGKLPGEVLQIVSRHHERWDGSGYPRGLRFERIGLAAEIAGLVDAFCAMLRNKPYRNAIGHQEALEELFQQRGKQFNPVLMEQFVQCVGLYPIGVLVEFESGEVGVVIQQNRVQRSRPRVLLMLDHDKQPVRDFRLVDLRQPELAALRIARALPNDAYGLSSHDYYLG